MSLINISNLTFSYDNSYDEIFSDVSFQIDTDWKLGFCGRNGRGKTTFLKLLTGEYEYRGTITASVNFDYFPPAVKNLENSTISIIQGIAERAKDWQIKKELSKLTVDEDVLYRPFSTLSNGEKTKVLLAGLFLRENNFLLIDEPTNHLDMEARLKVAQYLKTKAGFILVSHDRAFLDECTDHILSINKTDIEIISGNFSTFLEQKARRDAFELSQNEKLKKEIGRLESAARRTATFADKAESAKRIDPLKVDNKMGYSVYQGAKSKKLMAQSKSIEGRQTKSIEEKSKLLKNIESAEELKIQPMRYHAERLLTLKDVTVTYGTRDILQGFNLTLSRGDRLALLGGNGSGKSSIIKLICGESISHTGYVDIGSRLIISYVPQDASLLTGSLKDYAKEHGICETLFKSILFKLDFSRIQFEKDMRDFSQGQKKKVLIARSLCERAHVYIWDEPLNYIDILSRMQIEDLILTFSPTMIFVEHDKAFCGNIATKTISL